MTDGHSKRKIKSEEDTMSKKLKIKSEEDDMSKEHSHKIYLKFDSRGKKYEVNCNHPQTVLNLIKSKVNVADELKSQHKSGSLDQYLTLQMGEEAIPTHFPCSRLPDGKHITVKAMKEPVEVIDPDRTVTDEKYYVVKIKTTGGTNAKTKTLFMNSNLNKQFERLCVYGPRGMSIFEAINRDGRFKLPSEFELEDVFKDIIFVSGTENIEEHERKTFQICFKRETKENKPKDIPNPEQKESETSKVDNAAVQSTSVQNPTVQSTSVQNATVQSTSVQNATVQSTSVQNATGQANASANKSKHYRVLDMNLSSDINEIYELLRRHFPDLKKTMLERNDDNKSLDKFLQKELKKVDFGKAQQAFSDVYRLGKVIQLGKSVCRLLVSNLGQGTAFVLFDHYILTNAHLLKEAVTDSSLNTDVKIIAQFNYVHPTDRESEFEVEVCTLIDVDWELDYAVLELGHAAVELDHAPVELDHAAVELDHAAVELVHAAVGLPQDKHKLPPGLMKEFVSQPDSGEACIVGHPEGQVKKIDPICIIKKQDRGSEVNKQLDPFKDNWMAALSLTHHLSNMNIGKINDNVDLTTYNTFMYYGSSGSPVFDNKCKVFGMHSAGFTYGLPPETSSVIEYSHPVDLIFQRFVTKLKKEGREDLLNKVREHSKGNPYLMNILSQEPMEH